jgi:hypothetical protein
MIANHAETREGLLYLSGGGWSDHWRAAVPANMPGQGPVSHFGIAVTILVGWTETNRHHRVEIRVENEDGGEPLAKVEADLEMGRPPGAALGGDQRAMMALNVDTVFPAAGGYRIVAEMPAHDEAKSVSFRVHDQPIPGQALPGAPEPS